MRICASMRAVAIVSFGLWASACGGYSSKGTYYPSAVPQLLIEGALSGAAETVVASAGARGSSLFDFHDTGSISFAVTAEASWSAGITGVHIHRGPVGADGPAEVDVLGQGASFDPVTRTAAGTLAIPASLAGEIMVSPSYFYLQITTVSAPSGLVRAQLAPATTSELHALMRGAEEPVVLSAAARGAITFAVGLDRTVHYVLAMATPSISQISFVALRSGSAGVAGPVELDVGTSIAASNPSEGTLTADLVAPLALLTRVALDPSAFYVEMFTIGPVTGMTRGQLTNGPISLFATLDGSNEIPVADAAARGGVTLELTSLTTGRAIYAVPATQSIATITGVDVRVGVFATPGASLLDLRSGADFAVGADAAEGAITLTQSEYTRLYGNPAAFYAEFHRAAAPTGLARGQFGTDPVIFRAPMLGSNEVPIVNVSFSGTTQLTMTGVHQSSFDVAMTSPPANTLTGAHAHAGAAGVNGPIQIDFLSGTGITTSATHLTGDASFTGRTLASMIAAPGLFYANMHTNSPAPGNGVCRGQFLRVTDSAPPSGLVYATPVIYVTASPITPNTPSSTGGAVASYAISPALPAGLALNTTSGIISGTPTAVSAATNYTVTATNTLGSTNVIVNIKVNVAAPTNLVYTSPVTYVNGSVITANNPTNSGGAIASYAGTLPAGLTVDAVTGVISGTPTVTVAAANYTVTGTNATSSTNATVNITVLSGITPPTNLTYSSPVSYATGATITANAPSVTGGPITTYSVSPALPAGLSLDTSTGVISGKPTATATVETYTVTAANANNQSTTFGISVTVTLGAPAGLTYSPSAAYGYVTPPLGVTMNASSTGGAVASYSITPALPTGIALNTTTGQIAGTPTGTSAQATYTVTATNATGSTTATVTVTVPY